QYLKLIFKGELKLINNIKDVDTLKDDKPPIRLFMIVFLFFYAILALERIKKIFSFSVEGHIITNELWIIPFICYFIYLLEIIRRYRTGINVRKENIYFLIIFLLYSIVILIGGFRVESLTQYLYACALFLIPILVYFPT